MPMSGIRVTGDPERGALRVDDGWTAPAASPGTWNTRPLFFRVTYMLGFALM